MDFEHSSLSIVNFEHVIVGSVENRNQKGIEYKNKRLCHFLQIYFMPPLIPVNH